MSEQEPPQNQIPVWKSILTDIHFWVPAVVLAAGLLVLRWIR